ncbi:MAG: hypothetical protein JWO32_1014 [Bacteroidetes bacterium]|nr:hypothetical protein [Bacteroidota bacterium]
MEKKHKLTHSPFHLLQKCLTDFSTEGTVNKIFLLQQCSSTGFPHQKQILNYHNSLLFLLSHAENQKVFNCASNEMERLTSYIKKNNTLRKAMSGSGLAGTSTRGAYSLTLIKFLLDEFPGDVSLYSFDKTGQHPKAVLKHVLPETEFDLLADEKLKPYKWIEKASGSNDPGKMLWWLITAMDGLKAGVVLKDELFESLKLYIDISSKQQKYSKSYGTVKVQDRYFHGEGLLKKFDEKEIINKKLPLEKKLTNNEKKNILTAARIALCLLNRETDPITYCEDLNLKYYELDRGLSIALFGIDSERGLPVESYVGFMMFKNGYPMAYGGAWLFGQRSLIGINIFEAYRGGESAYIFSQLLRCYRMAFRASYFEVEPYQFGKNNPEGIQSGAFWFYYRFGFRPCNSALYELSLSEHKKINETKGYRSSPEILKKFTASNLFVQFDNTLGKTINPADISRFITHMVIKNFQGNRKAAVLQVRKLLKKEKIIKVNSNENAVGLNKLDLFIGFCFDLENVPMKVKDHLNKIIVAKGKSEFEYIQLLNSFHFDKYLTAELKQFLL